jgi:hypothetical protein
MESQPEDCISGSASDRILEPDFQRFPPPGSTRLLPRVEVVHQHGPGRQGDEFSPDQSAPAMASLQVHQQETLLFPRFGERGALH